MEFPGEALSSAIVAVDDVLCLAVPIEQMSGISRVLFANRQVLRFCLVRLVRVALSVEPVRSSARPYQPVVTKDRPILPTPCMLLNLHTIGYGNSACAFYKARLGSTCEAR